MASNFSLNTVVTVSVASSPALPTIPNVNTAAVVTTSARPSSWPSTQVYGEYTNATDVATDWGATSDMAAMATAFFAQNPNPINTDGYLIIIPVLQSPSEESYQAAITRTMGLVYYFGVLIDAELAQSDPTAFAALAAYCQANDKMLFYCSSNANDLNSGSALDKIRSAGDTNTRCMYYGAPLLNGANAQQTQIFAAAYAGRGLSVDFNAAKSTITMNLKQLATISADSTLTQAQLTSAMAAGVDVYANLSSYSGLLISGANSWFDDIYNQFWLKFAIQTAGFNLLAGTNTKISLTEDGMDAVKGVLHGVMQQAVANGYLAPGTWPEGAPLFGNTTLLASAVARNGYYIYSSPVANQTAAQLAARQAPPITIAALTAGAIQTVQVNIQVSLG